jgi:hypothetical protein
MKRNVTLQLDDHVIRRAKVLAAKRGTSVSGLVAAELATAGRCHQSGDLSTRSITVIQRVSSVSDGSEAASAAAGCGRRRRYRRSAASWLASTNATSAVIARTGRTDPRVITAKTTAARPRNW